MIKDLDLTLLDYLKGEAERGSELDSAKISFAVPSESWQAAGTGLNLNMYLYNLREKRKLRSNEMLNIYTDDGKVVKEKAPFRLECNYLITAWDKATNANDDEKVQQEHRLLTQVVNILYRHETIPPTYLRGVLIGQKPDLPIEITQQDGFHNMVEFWSALNSPLRPSINCQITIALYPGTRVGPLPVTVTRTSVVAGEEWIEIMGWVVDSVNTQSGIKDATVKIESLRKEAVTDSTGRFSLFRLQRGTYLFTAQAPGYKPGSADLKIPADEGGDYRIILKKV